MPTAKVLMKNCKHCSAPMERKRINGRLEDFTVFQKRKFCDQKCMAEAMLKEDPSRSARNKMSRKIGLKPACEKCGTTQKLAIHHQDRNWRNNDPSNLQTLCGSCHTSLHHACGEISPAQPKPPCMYCGKQSYRAGVCSTCRTRIMTHGTPFPKQKEQTL